MHTYGLGNVGVTQEVTQVGDSPTSGMPLLTRFTASLFRAIPVGLRQAALIQTRLPHWTESNCRAMASSPSHPPASSVESPPDPDADESQPGQPEAKRMKLCPPLDDTVAGDEAENGSNPPAAKVYRKKCALLLSYSGKDYKGMQRNPGVKTIEEDLIQALYTAGAITEEMRDNLGKLSFQRCARTDKGVSAARQLVSLKMVSREEMVEAINTHLPSDIHVMSLFRTTKGFNSKDWCSARSYEYLIPTYAFARSLEDLNHKYRMSPETMAQVNKLLGMYKGTHNFHNFTSGKRPGDPSCMRYIIDFACEPPQVREEIEYAALCVKGQSFMLHQIRKMIGLVIAVMRGYAKEEIIERSLQKEKLNIPRAPGLYLILDNVHFERYNRKFGEDGVHKPLEWSAAEERIREFKDSVIYLHIHRTELHSSPMAEWLASLNIHDFVDTDSVPLLPAATTTCSTEQSMQSAASPQEGEQEE